MASIYTCPMCRRRYTIYADGDYLCECGEVFAYPPVLSKERACFISVDELRREMKRRRVAPRSQKKEPGFAESLIQAVVSVFL